MAIEGKELEDLPFDENTIGKLKSHSPFVWHQVATSVNAGNPFTDDLLQWIIEQRDCQKATALHIFTNWYLYDYIAPKREIRDYEAKATRLARTFFMNLKNGFYQDADFGTDNLNNTPYEILEHVKKHSNLEKEDVELLSQFLNHKYPTDAIVYTGYTGDENGLFSIKKHFPKKMWHFMGVPVEH